MEATNKCVECGKEICGCGDYRRHYGTDDIPRECQDWIVWSELDAEDLYSRKWFLVVLTAMKLSLENEADFLSTIFASEFGPQDYEFGPEDGEGYHAAMGQIRDEWEALKRTAGICDGVHSDA